MALTASLVADLSGAGDVRVAGREVRLSDVAEVRGPGSEAARRVVIARVRQGSETAIARRKLAQLIRRAVPGVRVTGNVASSVVVRSAAIAQVPAGRCFEAANELPAGAPI